MPRSPLFVILKKVYTNKGTSSLALPSGRLEFARFVRPQIKRQFNVFPLCLSLPNGNDNAKIQRFGNNKKKKARKCSFHIIFSQQSPPHSNRIDLVGVIRLMTEVGIRSMSTQSEKVPTLMRITVPRCSSMGTDER